MLLFLVSYFVYFFVCFFVDRYDGEGGVIGSAGNGSGRFSRRVSLQSSGR